MQICFEIGFWPFQVEFISFQSFENPLEDFELFKEDFGFGRNCFQNLYRSFRTREYK